MNRANVWYPMARNGLLLSALMLWISACSLKDVMKPEEVAKQQTSQMDSLMMQPRWETEPAERYPSTPKIWDLEHQKIWLELKPEQRALTGATELLFRSLRDHNDSLVIDADPETITITHNELIRASGRRISRIDSLEQGFAIKLDSALTEGDSLIVRLEYEAAESEAFHWVDPFDQDSLARPQVWGDGRWGGASEWVPTQYRPDDRFEVEYWITAPEEFITVANGTLLEIAGSTQTHEATHYWKAEDVAPYQLMWSAGKFEHWPVQTASNLIDAYTVIDQDPWEDMYQPLLRLPGSEVPANLRILPLQEWDGEATGTDATLWLTPFSQYDARAAGELSNEDAIREAWFEHHHSGVWTQRWSDAALLEGISRYLSLIMNQDPEQQVKRYHWRSRYFHEANALRRPLITDRFSNVSDWNDGHTRFKWPLLLKQMEVRFGSEAVNRAIRGLTEDKNSAREGVYERFRASLEKEVGKDLTAYLSPWVEQRGHPRIQIQVDTTTASVRLHLRQVQDIERQPVFPVQVPYELKTSSGVSRGQLRLDQIDSTFVIAKEGGFRDILVDPAGMVLADWIPPKLHRGQLTDRLQHPSVTVQLRALDYLWSHPDARDGLEDLLFSMSHNQEYHWQVRQIALALYRVMSPEFPLGFQSYWMSPEEQEGRVRLEALKWAAQDTSKNQFNALSKYLDDPSYFVEAEAIKNICKYYPEQVDSTIYSYVDSTSYRSVLRTALAQGLRYVTDAQAISPLEDMAGMSTSAGFRLEAMRTLSYKYGQDLYRRSSLEAIIREALISPFYSIRKEGYRLTRIHGFESLIPLMQEHLEERDQEEQRLIQNTVRRLTESQEQTEQEPTQDSSGK
jgi:aminopeptidase N